MAKVKIISFPASATEKEADGYPRLTIIKINNYPNGKSVGPQRQNQDSE